LLTPASENPFGCRLVFLVLTQSFKASWHFAFFFWKFWFGVFFRKKSFGEGFSLRNLETRELAFGGWILEKREWGLGMFVCARINFFFRLF
jgi:hypothetical protein